MNYLKIERIISELKVDSLGRIRNKSRIINEIYTEHLKKLDSELMDIRVFVAKTSTAHSTNEDLKMIDEFIYKKQIGEL